jgi:hypothetical protein
MEVKMKKRIVVWLLVVGLVLVLFAGCQPAAEEETPESVKTVLVGTEGTYTNRSISRTRTGI